MTDLDAKELRLRKCFPHLLHQELKHQERIIATVHTDDTQERNRIFAMRLTLLKEIIGRGLESTVAERPVMGILIDDRTMAVVGVTYSRPDGRWFIYDASRCVFSGCSATKVETSAKRAAAWVSRLLQSRKVLPLVIAALALILPLTISAQVSFSADQTQISQCQMKLTLHRREAGGQGTPNTISPSARSEAKWPPSSEVGGNSGRKSVL